MGSILKYMYLKWYFKYILSILTCILNTIIPKYFKMYFKYNWSRICILDFCKSEILFQNTFQVKLCYMFLSAYHSKVSVSST